MDTLTTINRLTILKLAETLVDELPEGVDAMVIGFSGDGDKYFFSSSATRDITRKVITEAFVAVHRPPSRLNDGPFLVNDGVYKDSKP